MANRDALSRLSKRTSSKEVQLYVRGVPFSLDKGLLAARSAKIAALIKDSPHENLSCLLCDIPADPETFELVARFCHGFDLNFMSVDNVIPISCLAYYLEMTENHSKNNLLNYALLYLEQNVLPSWNETIKAFCSVGGFMQHAFEMGLIDVCLDSLVSKALVDPRLLGEPMKKANDKNGEGKDEEYRPNARRRLFIIDWKSGDLTTLPLKLYEPIIHAMNRHGVPAEYVAASVCNYAKKWVFSVGSKGDTLSMYNQHFQRDAIEAVERILPKEKGLIPTTLLFEMLNLTISLEVSHVCRDGLESRIGKQLEQATVKDLLIPSQRYARELQYDIECVKRILKHFYCNYTSSDTSGLISVAELVEDFLLEISGDIDLKRDTFIALAEMSKTVSLGTNRNSDGIYGALDIYLHKHRSLTEQEREEVCKVLDCNKMSPEACEHAARNERLPVRFVVQVLFVAQLQLRDTIAREVQVFDEKLRREDPHAEEDRQGEKVGFDEEVRVDMEKMSIKVMELEKECLVMRKEIESGCNNHDMNKGKVSMWGEMKRKLGCIRNVNDCNCQIKKKKVLPRY